MIYFIVTTLTTVGYGDITPINFYEILFIVIIIVNLHNIRQSQLEYSGIILVRLLV